MKFNGIACVLVAVLALCHVAAAEPAAALPTTRISAPLPTEAGHFRLRYLTSVHGKPVDMCLVVSNSKKIAQTPGKVPVLIFLLGGDERGSNGDLVFVNGPAAEMMRQPALNDSMPMMVVSPQIPTDFVLGLGKMGPESIVELVDLLAADPRVDPDRIYLSGISMGGRGTWITAAADPKAFAAIVPIAPAPAVLKAKKVAPIIKDIPIWMIYGQNDGLGITKSAEAMADALKQAGSTADVSIIAGAEHSATWATIYANPQFYDWLLTHVRGQAATKQYTSDELLKIATQPIDDPITAGVEHDFDVFAKYWHILNCGREGKPGLRGQVHGKTNVFVAEPLNAQVPCVMQGDVTLAPGKHAKLDFVVGRDEDSAWRLVVNDENGKELLIQKIDQSTAKDGWLETSVDLAAMGSHVRLQILCYQEGDKRGPAYFARMALDQQ